MTAMLTHAANPRIRRKGLTDVAGEYSGLAMRFSRHATETITPCKSGSGETAIFAFDRNFSQVKLRKETRL